jgi:flagellar biosynthesis protein FlhB
MAELDDDKSLDPTPHRRQQAREQGQVARSQDVGSAILLCGAIGVLLWLGRPLVDFLGHLMVRQLSGEPWLVADVSFVTRIWQGLMTSLAVALLPILALMMLLAIVGNVVQVGWIFLPGKALPDISRIDPLKGIGRLFSWANVPRLGFGLLKLVVVAGVAWYSLAGQGGKILNCGQLPLPELAQFMTELIIWTALKIGIALFAIAGLDYAYQRLRHERDLRMTPQEMRAELRNLNGDPQMANRRRALRQQFAKSGGAGNPGAADLVVTDAQGRAVAIQYDADTMAAPMVVAKESGVRGERLAATARQRGLKIVSRPQLAQALFDSVEAQKPIPRHLYAEVAALLARAESSAGV